MPMTRDERERLRGLHVAWEPYLPSSHRAFDEAARELVPALLDALDEMEHECDAAVKKHEVAVRVAGAFGLSVDDLIVERDMARAEVERYRTALESIAEYGHHDDCRAFGQVDDDIAFSDNSCECTVSIARVALADAQKPGKETP